MFWSDLFPKIEGFYFFRMTREAPKLVAEVFPSRKGEFYANIHPYFSGILLSEIPKLFPDGKFSSQIEEPED